MISNKPSSLCDASNAPFLAVPPCWYASHETFPKLQDLVDCSDNSDLSENQPQTRLSFDCVRPCVSPKRPPLLFSARVRACSGRYVWMFHRRDQPKPIRMPLSNISLLLSCSHGAECDPQFQTSPVLRLLRVAPFPLQILVNFLLGHFCRICWISTLGFFKPVGAQIYNLDEVGFHRV